MNMILAGKDCANCKYGDIDESNKARVKVHCDLRDKTYYFGQCIPCDSKEKMIEEEGEDNDDA